MVDFFLGVVVAECKWWYTTYVATRTINSTTQSFSIFPTDKMEAGWSYSLLLSIVATKQK